MNTKNWTYLSHGPPTVYTNECWMNNVYTLTLLAPMWNGPACYCICRMQFIILGSLWLQGCFILRLSLKACIFCTIWNDIIHCIYDVIPHMCRGCCHLMVLVVVWASLSIVKCIPTVRDYLVVYSLFMRTWTPVTLNHLGFGMLTMETVIFHWLKFDEICWLVPAAINSSIFVWWNSVLAQINIVCNRCKRELRNCRNVKIPSPSL